MIKKITLLFLVLLSGVFAFGQDTLVWKKISLKMDGGNTSMGVSAFYQITKYNGEDIVLMKLVNHNAYAVTVEWTPGVFTNEHQWIFKNDGPKRSVSIDANTKLIADCSGKEPELAIMLKDFPAVLSDVMRYGVISFNVSKK